MHIGWDISSNNVHPINFKQLYSFAWTMGGQSEPFLIVKEIQGTGYVNSDAALDIVAARQAGFRAIAGYLMDQGNVSVSAEEALYQKVAANLPQTDDIELPTGLTVEQYIAHSQQLLVVHPNAMPYYNQSEVSEGFPTSEWGIWLAEYNNQPGVVSKSGVTIHQFSSTETIPNVAGSYDINAWLGSEAMFTEFFGLGTPTTLPGGEKMSDFPGAVAAELTADGAGAWVVTNNGNVYTSGDAQEYGTLTTAGVKNVTNIVGIARSWGGNGYYIWGADGGIYCFGDAIPAQPVESYPGLPGDEHEGDRSFGGGSFKLGWGGTSYTLVALDGNRYKFGS
jgi:hypothetical protein